MKKIIIDKEDCTGCNACKAICPKNAITMQFDKKVFVILRLMVINVSIVICV